MKCTRCGVENVEGSNYCRSCGQPLSVPVFVQGGAAIKPETSGLAIASLVLSSTGLCCGITGIIGLVLGCVALSEINKSNGQLAGRGFAIAGIILGALSILSMILSVILFSRVQWHEQGFVSLPRLISQWPV